MLINSAPIEQIELTERIQLIKPNKPIEFKEPIELKEPVELIGTSYLPKFQKRAVTNPKNYLTKNDENLQKPKGGQ